MTKEMKTTGITAGVIFLGALVLMFFIYETRSLKDTKSAEIAVLEGEIQKLQAKVDTRETLQRELNDLRVNLAQYVRILPSPEIATYERLMELVQEKADRSEFKVISISTRPEAVRPTGRGAPARPTAFQEVEVSITATGSYDQFLRFLNALERHENFVRVNSFSCTLAPPPPASSRDPQATEVRETWPLNVALNISTFRFNSGGN